MTPLRIGIVGCGNISGIYFQNLNAYKSTQIVAVADLDLARAQEAAAKHGVPTAQTTEALLANPDVDLVLNLTIPKAHAAVAQAAVEAGKHVYNEKPLTVSLEDGRKLIETAKSKGVRVGCAPDTFLGGSHQTCRAIIDRGLIGEPVAANAAMLCRGHETWHPSPEFYYEKGGGPMLDMGPYYLTALVNMLGPVARVAGSTRISFPTRTITSQPKAGKVVEVETPTHLAGTMDFANGAVGQITTSFDVHGHAIPAIIVFGSEGTMEVPDPNGFGGRILLRNPKTGSMEEFATEHGYTENSRGLGVLDMAYAIQNGGAHRVSGDLALHVLEVMHSFEASSTAGAHQKIVSTVDRPAAFAIDQYAAEVK